MWGSWRGSSGMVRSLRRLISIARVLSPHGVLHAICVGVWPAKTRLREALEELGMAVIKFGQVLAMRRDLLPEAYTSELERLHDQEPRDRGRHGRAQSPVVISRCASPTEPTARPGITGARPGRSASAVVGRTLLPPPR